MLVEQRGDAGNETFLVGAIDEQYGGFFHAVLSLIHRELASSHLRWGSRGWRCGFGHGVDPAQVFDCRGYPLTAGGPTAVRDR
jgi:hypothetical protein